MWAVPVTTIADLSTVANWAQIISFALPLLLGVSVWIVRRWVHELTDHLVDAMKEQTKPIQPTANGGLSLPDVVKIVTEIRDYQIDTGQRVARIEGALDTHLESHR